MSIFFSTCRERCESGEKNACGFHQKEDEEEKKTPPPNNSKQKHYRETEKRTGDTEGGGEVSDIDAN